MPIILNSPYNYFDGNLLRVIVIIMIDNKVYGLSFIDFREIQANILIQL
jgi:hypothetical protein